MNIKSAATLALAAFCPGLLVGAEQSPNEDQLLLLAVLVLSGLKPWATPVEIGSRTLVLRRDPRPEWDPAKVDFIPTDQLAIKGKYVGNREIRDGLGAPVVAKRVADPKHILTAFPITPSSVTAPAETLRIPATAWCLTGAVIRAVRSRNGSFPRITMPSRRKRPPSKWSAFSRNTKRHGGNDF